MNKISLGAAISLALSLAACGGSSENGGGGNNPPPAPIPTGVAITAANVVDVSSTASDAALSGSDLVGMTDIVGVGGGATKPQPMKTAAVVAKGTLNGGVTSSIPLPETTTPCVVSGSVTVSGDIANPLTYTAGDTINVDSDNCDDGTGETVDGLIEMTISSFEGDILLGSFLLGMDLAVTDFSVTVAGETEVANGDVGTTVDTRQSPTLTSSVFGDEFEVVSGALTQSLSDFRTDYIENGNTFSNDSLGTVNSSDLAGSIDYATTTPFSGIFGDYPSEGVLVVTGADSTSVTLTAIDNVNVQIEADYDGDGMIDETIMTTWAELEGEV